MIIYNIAVYSYFLLIKTASLFNNKAKLWIEGRKNIFSKLQQDFAGISGDVYWFHAASLGEFEQGRPLIEAIKQKNPSVKILLTFFSPSGYEIRKNYEHADFVYYLPVDNPANAKKFIEIVNPKKIFFIKYEFWQNYLKTAYRKQIPVYLISGIFRKDQLFFKPYAKNYRKVLNYFTYFFVQNNKSKELLQSVGYQNVTVSGDTRFDRVRDIAGNSKEIELVKQFAENKFTLVVGSSWAPDEEILFQYIENHKDKLRLVLAPHEIHNSNIKRIQKQCPVKSMLFSEANLNNIDTADVLIINNIGMLSSLYKYGQAAYIGGGFGAGIHNILEASVYGIPVVFGPKYQKFDEAVNCIKHKAGFSIDSYKAFENIMNKLIDDKEFLGKTGKNALNFMQDNYGASDKILAKIFKNEKNETI